MNKYKNLQLNRDDIIKDIRNYLDSKNYTYNIESTFKKVGDVKRLHIEVNKEKFFLDFYFKKENKTTININSGPPSDYKVELAELIYINREEIDSKTYYTFKGINNNLFKLVIMILEDDELCDSCNFIESEDPNVLETYELYCVNQVRLKITYYKTTTVLLQGIQHKLFLRALSLFYECLDNDGIDEFIRTSLNAKDTYEDYDLDKILKDIMPNYYSNAYQLQQYRTINMLIKQSILYLNENIKMIIYDPLVFCAYKALEAQLQIALYESGVKREKDIRGDLEYRRFDIFEIDKMTSKLILRQDIKDKIKEKNPLDKEYKRYVSYIENTYNLYKKRNHIFHANTQPEVQLDQTFFIENFAEAKEDIVRILEQIDLYHES